MKNLTFTIIIATLFLSCDRVHPYKYKIINKTNHLLTIHYLTNEYSKIDSTVIIEKNSSKIIFSVRGHGAEGYAPCDSPDGFDIKELKIINSNIKTKADLSDRKNWDFKNVDNYEGLYTLTIDTSKLIFK